MYGMIHNGARSMVVDQFGTSVWQDILEAAGLGDQHFISGQHYSDEITMRIIGAICEKSGKPMDTLLREFGIYWTNYAANSAYGSMFRIAGGDLLTFLGNLNRMHDSILTSMPEAKLPYFEVLGADDQQIELLYHSDRVGLAPFLEGLLIGLLNYFKMSGEVTHREKAGRHHFMLRKLEARKAA